MTGHIPYLNTEYARNKDVECYRIEARKLMVCKTCIHRLNDHDEEPCLFCHEKSEWQQDDQRIIPGTAPVTKAG